MIGEKPLNIGKFEVLPKVKQYENYLEFLNDYSRDLRLLNSMGENLPWDMIVMETEVNSQGILVE